MITGLIASFCYTLFVLLGGLSGLVFVMGINRYA